MDDNSYVITGDDTRLIEYALVGAHWCVKCKREDNKHEYASYIFDGESLCEKHIEECK